MLKKTINDQDFYQIHREGINKQGRLDRVEKGNLSENNEERNMLSKRWMIFKQNINDILSLNKLQSFDEREEEIKSIEEEIKKEKEEYKLEMINRFSEKNVNFIWTIIEINTTRECWCKWFYMEHFWLFLYLL